VAADFSFSQLLLSHSGHEIKLSSLSSNNAAFPFTTQGSLEKGGGREERGAGETGVINIRGGEEPPRALDAGKESQSRRRGKGEKKSGQVFLRQGAVHL